MNFNFGWKKMVLFSGFVLLGEGGLEPHFLLLQKGEVQHFRPKREEGAANNYNKSKERTSYKGPKMERSTQTHQKKCQSNQCNRFFSDFSFRFWLKCKNANFALRKNKRQSKAGMRKERRAHRKDMCKLSKIVNLKNIQNVN